MTPPIRMVGPSGETIDPALVDVEGASVGDVLQVLTGPVAGFGPGVSATSVIGIAFDFPGTAGDFSLRPLPFAGIFVAWWGRRDGSGDAAWTVEYAVSPTAAFATVGGTQPSITGAEGNSDTNGLDWTTLTFVAGGVLRVTQTSFTGTGTCSGLTIGATRT